MDRLAALFEQLSLPEVARLLRRTVFSAIGVGVVALGVATLLSHPLVGLGVCIGLGLGLVNIRLITRSVAKLVDDHIEKPRRILISGSLRRLFVTTAVVIALTFASVQIGLGCFAGIALFYFVLTANVVRDLAPRTHRSNGVNPSVLAATVTVGDHITRKLFGLTINFDTVISTLVASAIVLGLGFYLRAKVTSGVPRGVQLAFETIVGEVESQVSASMGDSGKAIVPLAFSLFMLILIANWLELIPTGHSPQYLPPPSADVNFTFALAAFVIVMVHVAWLRHQGVRRYVGHYFRPFKAMFPINVIEEITKPITLALRLFGNIFAGGLLLVIFAEVVPTKFIVPIPLLDVIWKLFDGIFVGPLQAFIFALLTILYFEAPIAGNH